MILLLYLYRKREQYYIYPGTHFLYVLKKYSGQNILYIPDLKIYINSIYN